MMEQGSKPWRYTGNEKNMQRMDIKLLVKKWWDIYNDESLDYQRPVGTNQVIGAAGAVNQLQPLIAAAMTQASAVKYVTAPSAA